MGNFFAYLMLVAWFPFAWALFATQRVAVATAVTVIGGALFLPEGLALDAPVVPPFDKTVIGPLAALTGALWATPQRMLSIRPYRGIDSVFLLIAVGTIGTVINNGDVLIYGHTVLPAFQLYDGIAQIVIDHLRIYVPFLLGRSIYQSSRDMADFLRVCVVSGLIYSFFCLVEMRFSPQLHFWIYGFAQHSFEQTMRGDGYRPMVFMSHGLTVARFMFGALMAAAVLRRARVRMWNMRGGWSVAYLAIILVFCRSTGAMIFAVTCLPLVLMTSARMQMRVTIVLASIVMLFPILRATDLVPVTAMLEHAKSLSVERAESLQVRFINEDLLLERARERLLFGWGGYGRNRIFDPQNGEDLSITDGEWVIVLGTRGAVGFAGWYLLYLAPIFLLWRRFDCIESERVKRLAAGTSLLVVVFAVDTLPNASGSLSHFFLSGMIIGFATRQLKVTKQNGNTSKLYRHAVYPGVPYAANPQLPKGR